MPENIGRIVVAGGDPCAPAVAAFIANSLKGSGATIVLLDDLSSHGGAASALPTTVDFYRQLHVSEENLIAETGATFKLGTEHSGWLRNGRRFVQTYGEYGIPIRLLPFHQYYLKQRLSDASLNYDDFSIASVAARSGRFAFTKPPLRYGLQIHQQRFAGAMLQHATAMGVEHVSSVVRSAVVRPGSDYIDLLTLDDGSVIKGDLFIDCTGETGLLIGDALRNKYLDWSEFLPCNRCARTSTTEWYDPTPMTRAVAKADGWSRRMQLLDRSEFEFFYNSDISSDAEIAKQFAQDVGAGTSGQVDYRSVSAGRRESFWRGNCVAIGRSAGNFEPLEASSTSTAHNAVMRLMTLWPYADFDPAVAHEYNRLTTLEYDSIRDFIGLFYAASDRDDTDFWRHCQSMKKSETLESRLALFRSRGRLSWNAAESFSRDKWTAALVGLNVSPRDYDPLVDVADAALVDQYLTELRQEVEETVNKMPSHIDFLRGIHSRSGKAASS